MGLSAALFALAVGGGPVDSARVHVLTDTTSVTVRIAVPAGRDAGALVDATITSAADERTLWKGQLGRLAADGSGGAALTRKVSGLDARRWSPDSPSLYHLTVRYARGDTSISQRVRFGFRSVSADSGRILLNGKPIFLRGNAINPPDRNIPDSLEENRRFVEPYVRYLKSQGVNIIRLLRHSEVWFEVCDELGMMLFQGNYGTPKGGKPTEAPSVPLSESVEWYRKDVLGPLVNHPSVVVYVLANEQADTDIHYLSKGADGINAFLGTMYDSLSVWDPTRVYIANAGYGFGRVGEVCDMHRYWGWYYNSFLSFYTMRDPRVCWRKGMIQPITMTENTGNYTGIDGRFNLVSNTKQPDSQLNWTGHAPDAEQPRRALAYQAWMAGQAIEIFRRSRARNPYLAGITPFTIVFHDWWGISSFEDMRPKPVARQYGVSFQPILLSWELWTSQVYAGTTLAPVAHVVNDSDSRQDLRGIALAYQVLDGSGRGVVSGRVTLPNVAYYEARSTRVEISLPASLATGSYTLSGAIVRGADTLSRNQTSVFVAARSFPRSGRAGTRRVVVHDSTGTTFRALTLLGVRGSRSGHVSALSPTRDLLVIGADSWTGELARQTADLRAFIARGGRVLVLHQNSRFDGSWLPAPVRVTAGELDHSVVMPGNRPYRNGMAVNPERADHPVLAGIDRDRLFLWSDYTGWVESKPGFPEVYPVTRGFVLSDAKSLSRAAVIANYDHGLEGIAIAELFDGDGSAMMTGMNLVDRAGRDPVADQLLLNLLGYMGSVAGHTNALEFSSKIVWGDYASERGLLTGIYNGLIVNTVPRVPADLEKVYPVTVDANGFVYAGGSGGWNTKPAIQYFARGRRPFGPYSFSYGGSVVLPTDATRMGEGRVVLRVPADRRTMLTTVSNPVKEDLPLEIEVNGARQAFTIPPGDSTQVRTAVRGGALPLQIVFRGDRRLVLLETDFR